MYPFPLSKLKYLCFFSWCFFFLLPSQVSALDPDIIKVRNAIKEAVGGSSSNIEVGIFGSHVDGKNFLSPLKGGSSDFDMRLVFKNIAPDDPEALRQWQAFREKLRQALEKQYPDAGELAKILDKTNVYPPEELMKGVSGREAAFKRFKQLNVSPKLSHQSAEAMTDATFKELAGGLYGETTEKATRQSFEKTVGKVIGKDAKGQVKEFLADLTHRAEGEGIYTVKGSGNAASQWIDDALAAIEKGNTKGIAKNVQRAKILIKGKDLARMPLSESDIILSKAADEMEAILNKFGNEALEGKKLAEFEKRVNQVVSFYRLNDLLRTCKIDAELLKKLGNPKFEGLIVDGLLKGAGKWGKLRGALGQLWAKVPEGTVPAVLNVVILTFTAPEQYEKEGALKAALESAIGLVTLKEAFGPLGWAQLASTITVSVLEIVAEFFKDRIYEFAAGSQSCSGLIAGIYTVKGRETQAVDPILEAKCHNVASVEDLACYTPDEGVVLRLIECHAKNAAKRFEGGGAGEKETAKGISDALMKKCGRDGQNLGSVLRDWQGTRESFKNQLDDLTRNFDGASLKIWARPDPAEIDNKGPVTVKLEAEIANFSERTGKAILQCLGGQNTLGFVYPKYKWGVNGILQKETTLPYVDLNFDKPGEYRIDLALEIEYGSDSSDIKGGYLSKGGQFSLTVNKKEEKTSKDEKKDDKKDQTTAPPVIPQPDSYTKGQAGIGLETGIKVGEDTQTSTPGQTDTGKSDIGKNDTEKTDIGIRDMTPTGKADPGKPDTTTRDKRDVRKPDTTTGKTDTGKPDIGTRDTTPTGKTDPKKTDTTITDKRDVRKPDTTTGKTDTGKIDKTTTGKPDTSISTKRPSCTFKYSEWGECSRATKKQSRIVIGKEPAGCQETTKPDLEQGCIPPAKPFSQITNEEKNQLLNCLCQASMDHVVGCAYTPTPIKSVMTCFEDSVKAPCNHGEWGCNRHLMYDNGERTQACYKSVNILYDKNAVKDLIKTTNKKFIQPLKVTFSPDAKPIKAQYGDVIKITANIQGGMPGYKFSWSGQGEAKDNTFTFANARQPGSHLISVTVTDSEGSTVTATCTINVDALKVKIDLLDAENKILIGGSRNFKGMVLSGNKPASGDFYFLWQPHPEIAFSPFEKTGGNLSETKATFRKLGKFKVWVIAHTYKGNVKTTIGESEQIEIEVSRPELKLTFQPQNPKVGQEIKLTVSEKPKMADQTASFWWEISGNTLNAGPLKNEREYTFRPKDSKPVTVTVHGKAKDGGGDLGEAKATITAQAYDVKVSQPQHRSPKPQIWKCDTQMGRAKDCGIVELDKELAVFNDIFIKASVTPEPEKTPLRYTWSIDPTGVCGIPGSGQELKLNCSQPGSYTVMVKVRDSQDVELGTASTQASITVTKEDIDKGKKPLVTLQTDKTVLKTGEIANIKANVQGGKQPYTYQWGEGLDGKGEAIRFIPKKSGQQKIAVEVTDKSGARSSASLDIKVETAKLEVSLKPDKTSTKTGEKVSLKAEIKGGEPEFTYKWSEGIEGKGDSTQFTPKKSGTQKITLEVSDGKGQKASASIDIKVTTGKLEASVRADKSSVKTGEKVSLKAEVKGGESPFTFKWNEGVEGKGESASLTPKKSGSQKVILEITDSTKKKVTASTEIKVEAPKLEVTLKADKKVMKVGETSNIKAEVKGGEPDYSYKWSEKAELSAGEDRSGGEERKAGTMRFTPKKAGTQKISLEVTDKVKQKAEASIEIVVESGKLEVNLTADKSPIMIGETAKLGAAVKGGTPPYSYTWSSQVQGSGETASFSSKTPGFFKIFVEVKDMARGKVVGKLDITVQEGKKETKTDSSGSQDKGSAKTLLDPEILKLPPGGSGLIRLIEKDQQGGTYAPADSKKISWKLEPVDKNITLKPQADGVVIISANQSTKIGTKVRIQAVSNKAQVGGTIEIIRSPERVSEKGKETEKEKEKKRYLELTETTATKGSKETSQGGYNPLSDPGIKVQKPTVDIAQIDKAKEGFQSSQWETLTKKTTAAAQGSQQNVQPQPTDYAKPSDPYTTKKPEETGSISQTQPPTPSGDPPKPSAAPRPVAPAPVKSATPPGDQTKPSATSRLAAPSPGKSSAPPFQKVGKSLTGTFEGKQGGDTARLVIRQDGTRFTGTFEVLGSFPMRESITGRIEGRRLIFDAGLQASISEDFNTVSIVSPEGGIDLRRK